MSQKTILSYLSKNLRAHIERALEPYFSTTQEIRIRVDKPLIVIIHNTEYFISEQGRLVKQADQAYQVTSTDIKEILQLISEYSVYAIEEELKNGFITLPGGHRIGVVGKTVIEKGSIKTIKYISGFNIRFSHEIIGCSEEIISFLINDNTIYHTLIVSAPMCGKTTLLRDIIRQFSNGIVDHFQGTTVGVVDERSEIAGCYKGIPQNDVGIRTDVLDGCPKSEGILMLLRSMAPKIIAVDEIGKEADIDAIWSALHAGVKIIATIHGNSFEDIQKKPLIKQMIQTSFFDRIIILSNMEKPGTIYQVIDGKTQRILHEWR